MARSLSSISQLVLCTRISNTVTLTDPLTGQSSEMRGNTYWESPFPALCETKDLIEFYVIDIQIESRFGKVRTFFVKMIVLIFNSMESLLLKWQKLKTCLQHG
jgi:NMD protein affecting ribosome stability and mRNA decay